MGTTKNKPDLFAFIMVMLLISTISIVNAETTGRFILTLGNESNSEQNSIMGMDIASTQSSLRDTPKLNVKITTVNNAQETTYYESNVSSLADISVDVLPGTYKIYIQNLSNGNIQEYNNDSAGYSIESGQVIPLEYKHAAGYTLDAPWRIEYSKDNISLLAIDYDLLAPDIKNISIYDANANDTIIQSTNWDSTHSISASNMPYFFLLNVDKSKFLVDEQNRISINIRFDLTGIYDDTQGPIHIYRAEKDLPKFGNWFYGDTHLHSNYTSNAWEFGAPIYATSDAINNIGLNWMTITDHSFDQTNLSTKWNDYLSDCDTNARCLRAEEVSCDWGFLGGYSHYLAYNISTFISGPEVYWGDTDTCETVIDKVNEEGFGYVAHPMHPDILRKIWQNYSLPFAGLEVWNSIGPSWESERDAALIKWIEQLLIGRKIFISAGSDAHGDFNSALGKVRTACYAPEFTKDNIFTALANGNCMMTDGPIVVFTANNHIIGESFNVTEGDTVLLNISWNSTKEFGNVTEIYLIRGEINGIETNETVLLPDNLSGDDVIASVPNNTYYRIEARSLGPDGTVRRAYTNPIWVYAEPRPEIEKIPMDETEHALITAFEEKYDYSLKDLFFDGWPLTDCQKATLHENLGLDPSWQIVKCEKMFLNGSRLMWTGLNNTNTGEKKIMLQIGGLLQFADATYYPAPYDPRYAGWAQGYRNDNWIAHKEGKEVFEINWIANSNPSDQWYFGTYLIHGFEQYEGNTTVFYSHWGPEQVYSNYISSHRINLNFDNNHIFTLADEGFVNSFISGRFNRGILQKKSFGYEASVFRMGSGSSFDAYNRTIYFLNQTEYNVRCHADIDCNDGNLLTKDTCINKATAESRCEHTSQEPEEIEKPFTEMDADEISKAIDFRNKYNKSLDELYFDGWVNKTCNKAGILETLRIGQNWTILQCQKFTINNTLTMFVGLNHTSDGNQYVAYQLGNMLIDENATYRIFSEPDYVHSYYINSWTATRNGSIRFEIDTFKARYCNPDFYNRWCSDKDATYIIHGFMADGNKNTNMLYSFKNFPHTVSPPFVKILFDNYMSFNLEDDASGMNSEEGIYNAKAFGYHALNGWTFGARNFNYAANNRSLFPPYRADNILVELGSPAHILVNDSEGIITGYFNGNYTNEIPGAEILETEPHERYSLPAGAQYNITVIGYESGNYSLKIAHSTNESAGQVYFHNIAASDTTHDVFEINGTALAIKTNDLEKNIFVSLENAEGNSSAANLIISQSASANIIPDWSNISGTSFIIEETNHPPEIVSIFPQNNSVLGLNQVLLMSINATDADSDLLEYSISFDGMKISDSKEAAYILNETGSHRILFNVSDGMYPVSEEAIIFVIAPPKIIVLEPENKTYNKSTILLSAVFEEAADTAWVSVDGEAGQSYVSGTSSITANIAGLSDGAHNITVYANNSIGAVNSSTAYFTIDTTAPAITINFPENNASLAPRTKFISINISTDENATCRYSTNSSFEYESGGIFEITGGTNHSFIDYGLHNKETYKLYYKCADTYGNINSEAMQHTFSVGKTKLHLLINPRIPEWVWEIIGRFL